MSMPDRLFWLGNFDAADRAYARVLHQDPNNVHAVAQRGYIALLHNRFGAAEAFLSKAIALDPNDAASTQRLAECLVRQDRHAAAVPLLQATGSPRDEAWAEVYAHLRGTPWQVSGAACSRVPFLGLDPVPSVVGSINGGEPGGFLLDTYATFDLSAAAAEEAGLRAIASTSGIVSGHVATMYLGILDSFRIGEIEIRNIPVQWIDTERPSLPDGSQPIGVLGTTTFYHLLTTMDYAGRALVLRRKLDSERQKFYAESRRRGWQRLPLWLAGDHFPCSVGSLRDYGPRVVTVDTGGIAHGLDTTVEMADRAGIPVDYDHPQDHGGGTVYPIAPDRISLARAVGHDVPGIASAGPVVGMPGPAQADQFGFEPIANFTHEFFKPFAVTFDYTEMNLYIEARRSGR